MTSAAAATTTAMEDDVAYEQRVVDDPRMQTIMDRCEDLGMDATIVDSIEQWTTDGVQSTDWRRFIAAQLAQLHQLAALPQPELNIASPATFQLQLNAILASLSYPMLSAGPYSLSDADTCADVTDFVLSEVQAARMLLTAQQPAARAAGGEQSQVQAELVKLARLLQQPIKPNTSAAQFFSSLSTALPTLSASHPSLHSKPLLSSSDYTPQQLASLGSVTSALSSSLSARLSRIHSRHTRHPALPIAGLHCVGWSRAERGGQCAARMAGVRCDSGHGGSGGARRRRVGGASKGQRRQPTRRERAGGSDGPGRTNGRTRCWHWRGRR